MKKGKLPCGGMVAKLSYTVVLQNYGIRGLEIFLRIVWINRTFLFTRVVSFEYAFK